MERRWVIQKPLNRRKCLFLSREWNLSPLMVQLLYNRGIKEEEKVKKFLYPSLEDLYDPFLMKGMDMAVQRIIKAISHKEKILIYGDYDVDGVTATTLLLQFLRSLGVSAYFYIPQREKEGYGLNKSSVEKAAKMKIELIITCDCGISCYEEIEYAKSLGLEVIVTDHHRVKEKIPSACAVLDPNQPDCSYPFKELAGVGVAFKLIQALAQRSFSKKVDIWDYLDLVALGTIADVVSLKDENRILVKFGLERLNRTSNLGLKALINVAGLSGKEIKGGQVGFILAPRLNACGRLSLARKAVKLLLSTSWREAIKLAKDLDRENHYRQKIEENMRREAEKLLPESKEPVIILVKDGWHPGIIGLLASYVREKYFRPTLIFSPEGDIARGSARSIPKFSIFNALQTCQDLLLSFGGHKMAAGMMIPIKNITILKNRLNKLAEETLSPEDLFPTSFVDATVNLKELENKVFEDIKLLPPHGPENPQPLFLGERLYLFSSPVIGKGYLKAVIGSKEGKERFEAIAFSLSEESKRIMNSGYMDALFTPEINRWRGKERLQLQIKDIRGGTSDGIIKKDQEYSELS